MIELNNSYFVHIPKTGGTWVRHVLKQTGLFKNEIGHPHDKCFNKNKKVFATVRHPVTWVRSLWAHWKEKPACRNSNQINMRKGVWSYKSFSKPMLDCITGDLNKTIENFTTKYPGYVSDMYDKYCSNADIIGKQETLRDDLYKFITNIEKHKSDKVKQLIFDSNKKQSYKAENTKADKSIMKRFMDKEPCIEKYDYNYIPEEMIG